ncbi:MAG: glycosyltransferase family 2 protein [Ruminobacter sp.]|nr:glycosyltransferase family 2 protein [Ruminobacter sp.]
MKTISAIVITKNEEMHIESCIKCLQQFADEVIIFDSMSTDRTGEIATSLGAKFIPEPIFPGYGPQRIKAQKHASCDFIFFLDSDERVTPELAAEIKEFVANAKDNEVLAIPRENYVLGQKIMHCGYYPDHVMRLYCNSYTTYNDALVHEKIIVKKDTVIKYAKNNLIHHTYLTYDSLLTKNIRYSEAWARDRFQKNKKCRFFITPFVKGAFNFFYKYFIRLGILDGKMGLIISLISAFYTFNKYFALYSFKYEAKAIENVKKDITVK